MPLFHVISAFFLISAHFLFLIQGFLLKKNKKLPMWIARSSAFLSQALPLPVIISGFIAMKRLPLPHLLVALPIPLLFLLAVFSPRLRKQHPWFIPLLNGMFLLCGLITGITMAL